LENLAEWWRILGRRPQRQFDVLSEFVEFTDMVTNLLLGIEFIKVVRAQIRVGLIVAKHEVNGDQDAVLDRANGSLFSPPTR
jgi:hypothetical protein